MGFTMNCNTSACSSQIQTKHRGICPTGWHIPSNDDWDQLLRYVDGVDGVDGSDFYKSPTAGKHLKAKNVWKDYEGQSGNGLDTYGFAALPGGYFTSVSGAISDGYLGYWWSTYEYNTILARGRWMYYRDDSTNEIGYDKVAMYSVRCLKD
jgi:uncharacterized protein (TIGR02145 family)